MLDENGAVPRHTQWLHPESDDNDLRRYVATIRERWRLIVVLVVVATAAAVYYVKTATPVYTAEAQLLVTPLNGTDASTLSGLGLIAQSSDPTQDVETASSLVSSYSVAQLTAHILGTRDSPQKILNNISVQPVSQSSTVAVTATAPTARGAADLATDFAQAAILVRSSQFRLLIDQKVANLQAQLAGLKGTPTATALQQQLAALDAFKAGPLPDMSVSADAVPPQGRTSPRTAVSLAVAIVAGLILGILGAFALEAFDTTFRREEQLRSLFSLPVLAKIPFERRARRGVVGPRPPESLSPGGREAYRTLRAMLLASNPARSILVTSASPREGKTTTAINLAMSLAASGARTILIEADMRLPSVGEALGVQSRYGLSDVLTGRVTLDRALVSDPRYSENLRFLLARGHRDHDMSGDALFLPTVFALLRDAEGMARHVIIDSPPLVAVIDAFELAVQADGVILVARLGKTNLGRLARLGELLSRAAVEPVGIALVGTQTPGGPGAHDYYQYGPPLAADTVSPRAIKAEPQP